MKVFFGSLIVFIGLFIIVVGQFINMSALDISNDTYWIVKTLFGGQGLIIISIGLYSIGSGIESLLKSKEK